MKTLLAIGCLIASLLCFQAQLSTAWSLSDRKACLANPNAVSEYPFDQNSLTVIDAFFGTGKCFYGKYCGKKCANKGTAIDGLDKCCQKFKQGKYSSNAFDDLSYCYMDQPYPKTNFQCMCNNKVQASRDKCDAFIKGCGIADYVVNPKSKASLYKNAYYMLDEAIGGEQSGGLAWCYYGPGSGGDGETGELFR